VLGGGAGAAEDAAGAEVVVAGGIDGDAAVDDDVGDADGVAVR